MSKNTLQVLSHLFKTLRVRDSFHSETFPLSDWKTQMNTNTFKATFHEVCCSKTRPTCTSINVRPFILLDDLFLHYPWSFNWQCNIVFTKLKLTLFHLPLAEGCPCYCYVPIVWKCILSLCVTSLAKYCVQVLEVWMMMNSILTRGLTQSRQMEKYMHSSM